jgi:type IV secretion system protein VirD4
MLLLSLIMYLHAFAPPEEQNFSMVLEMIRAGEVREDNDDYESPLDILFRRKEMEIPDHPSVRIYRNYRSGSARTLKSIQITLLSRLEKFDLESLAGITNCDEMEIRELGERKTALFAVISDNDPSFNFIVGMLYTQLFQELYYRADVIHGGSLPVHVRFLMDEFATVSIPQDFDRILATMRSREISVAIIIQNMTQLRALFEKQWESIVGNCDELLYLGGNEQSTHEFVSKMLGSGTIETESFSRNRGGRGSTSVSTASIGRALMTPDEVRMLDNRYAVLFIRGERPVKDLKYRLMRHPLIRETSDGGREPFLHGEDRLSVATVAFRDAGQYEKTDIRGGSSSDILILTEEEIYSLMKKKGMLTEEER